MCSILEGAKNIKKTKSVKKGIMKKKHICHEQYKETLFGKKTFRHSMDTFRTLLHVWAAPEQGVVGLWKMV